MELPWVRPSGASTRSAQSTVKTRRRGRAAVAVEPMVIGVEHEHAVFLTGAPPPDLPMMLCLMVLEAAGHNWPHQPSEQFRTNGARLYADAGEHPEYATPECTDPFDLIAADNAGSELLGRAAAVVERNLQDAYGGALRLHLLRTNVSPGGTSWGTHENYAVPATLAPDLLIDSLCDHLASRVCLTGSGTVLKPPGNDRAAFRLSARAAQAELRVAASATLGTSKPMVMLRNEPLADPAKFRRVQVICGDANRAEVSSLLKFCTTMLALRLIGAGAQPSVRLHDPVHALRAFSEDPDLTATVPTNRGRWRALDLQAEWCDAALRFADRHGLPAGEDRGLQLWAATIDRLAADPDALCEELDWVAKRKMLEAVRARHGLDWSDPRVLQAESLYHDLMPGRSLYDTLVRRGALRTLVPAEAVQRCLTVAPAGTRARARGTLLAALRASGLRHELTWSSCWYQTPAGTIEVDLGDPLDCWPSRFDEHLAALRSVGQNAGQDAGQAYGQRIRAG